MKDEQFFKERFNVSCETIDKLRLYQQKICIWQKKMNLVSKRSIQELWVRHFADCAQTHDLIQNPFFKPLKKKIKILDVGTGAGFPGVILSLLGRDKNSTDAITLLDSNLKKITFLRDVCSDLNLNVELLHNRVEKVILSNYQIVTARAVASLCNFFGFFNKQSIEKINFILPKGKSWNQELNHLKKKWKFSNLVVKNNIDIDKSGGVQILFKNVKRL